MTAKTFGTPAHVTWQEALSFANMVGFPVLVRPSYVLSGAAMRVIDNEDDGSPWTGRNDNGDVEKTATAM